MMNKDPETISSVLDFFSKKLDKFVGNFKEEDYQKTKEILKIESAMGMDKILFYNLNGDEFDGKSLLEYIDSQNVRLTRQREELIDLSIKIAKLNNKVTNEDAKESMVEVITHFKSGLHSGVGLRDMITQIEERYPWSSTTKMIHILVSLITCLLAIGLYVLDLTTDVQFSLDMLHGNLGNKSSEETEDFDDFLSKHSFNFTSLKYDFSECYNNMITTYNEKNNRNRNSSVLAFEDYHRIGWFSLWHCIQPLLVTTLVLISINYKKCCQTAICSVPDIPEVPNCKSLLCCAPFKMLWPLGYLMFRGLVSALRVLGRVVPIPAITKVYRFYLDVKCHIARSSPDFRTKIVSIEEEIKKHEALGEL